jgi:RNase P subunit RPR2
VRRKSPKKQVSDVARARISILWGLLMRAAGDRPELAQRARIKLPRDMNRQICKECGTVFVPGRNCRVRVRSNRATHLTVTCLVCGAVRRFQVIREA